MTQDLKTPKPPAASAPTASTRRFLAQLMEYSFREGWRTPDDFVKHFPANAIMVALKSAPDLRVAILAAATGIYEEILRRKTPALAAEDLRLALDEGTTSSLQLLTVFSPEDRVRYLDPRKIWDFLAEDRFWQLEADASPELRQSAAERMIFTLTQALQERLLTLREILDGLTYDAVADSLSPHELRSVVRYALVKGRDGIGLNEKVLLEVLPLDKLVRSVPLEHIWNEVVVRRLAIPGGLTDLSREERRVTQPEKRQVPQRQVPQQASEPRGRSSRPPALPPELSRSAPPASLPAYVPAGYPAGAFSSGEAVTAAPASRDAGSGYPQFEAGDLNEYMEDEVLTTSPPAVSLRDGSLLPPPLFGNGPASSPASSRRGQLTDDFNRPSMQQPLVTLPQQALVSRQAAGAQAYDAPDAEAVERQRQRVTEHLRAIGRLPPRHASMSAAVLRSIDAMYALLPSATDDIQRKSVIRQAFANENFLRVALLGLIELMDSSVDTSDPVIQEAKIEALIKILLFEEQRRKETGRFPTGPFSVPRLPSSMPPSSMPLSSMPPSSVQPGFSSDSFPPSSGSGGFGNRPSDAFYFPQQSGPAYAPGQGGSGPHVATQRPPPPVLSGVPSYPGSGPPLPNLPADPQSSRRRTVPPPLPPSYPRG